MRAEPAAAAPRAIPDAMSYELTIRRAGRVHRLSFTDPAVPADVRPLLALLTSDGRPA